MEEKDMPNKKPSRKSKGLRKPKKLEATKTLKGSASFFNATSAGTHYVKANVGL